MDPAWGNATEIEKKIDKYIAHNMPIEGIILDQYTKNDNCPFEIANGFRMENMQNYLQNKTMKMYLSINAGIEIG
jgi:alpha-glucosidase (family GH31 glycosyl hydrolase)